MPMHDAHRHDYGRVCAHCDLSAGAPILSERGQMCAYDNVTLHVNACFGSCLSAPHACARTRTLCVRGFKLRAWIHMRVCVLESMRQRISVHSYDTLYGCMYEGTSKQMV